MQIRGRSILVTGGSSGIGAATAMAVARAGARPILFARSHEKLEAVVSAIAGEGGSAVAHSVDCGDREAVGRATDAVRQEIGTPDVIVNNAGAGRFEFFDETDPAAFDEYLAAPFLAAVYVTRAFLPAMIERRAGLIVNVNTPAAWFPWPGAAGYASARWALRGFTEALRADLRGTGVKVSQVVPGAVSSPYLENNAASPDALPGISRLVRTVRPEEVADAIVVAIERERRQAFLPPMLRAMMFGSRFAPRLTEELVGRTGRRRPPA